MRRALVIAAALALLAACGSSNHTATSLPSLTSAKLAKIHADALSTAKGNTDPQPSSVVTLVLDQQTLAQLDYGFGAPVDTSKVGPGLPVHLS